MMVIDTDEQLIKELWALVDTHGSQESLAAKLGVSKGYLNDVLHRRRDIGPAILSALGYEKAVTYRKIR